MEDGIKSRQRGGELEDVGSAAMSFNDWEWANFAVVKLV